MEFHLTLQNFPYLAQDLISKELHWLYRADMELANNDEMIRTVDGAISCTCHFGKAINILAVIS